MRNFILVGVLAGLSACCDKPEPQIQVIYVPVAPGLDFHTVLHLEAQFSKWRCVYTTDDGRLHAEHTQDSECPQFTTWDKVEVPPAISTGSD